jgi:hypothetical protein
MRQAGVDLLWPTTPEAIARDAKKLNVPGIKQELDNGHRPSKPVQV